MTLENPRELDGNLATIYTWTRSHISPDSNPYKTPTDFFREKLEELYPDTKELSDAIDNWPDSGLSHRIGSYCSDEMWMHDYTQDDFVYDALAEQPEAYKFCANKMPMRTVYMLDHSAIHYATTSFSDPWDSGAVGVAFVDPDDMEDTEFDRCLQIIDAEVSEYDNWLNGVYDEDTDYSDITGFRCPQCGNTAEFDATSVVLYGNIHITPDGWDWSSGSMSACISDSAHLICASCGYDDKTDEFLTE